MPSKHKKDLLKNKKKEMEELKKQGKWEPRIDKKPVKKVKQASFLQQLQNKANQQINNNTIKKSKLPLRRVFGQILAIIFVLSLILASIAPLFR